MSKAYIGDSVYAEFDGWHIVLTTENGYPDDPRNKICLDPNVWDMLVMYVNRVRDSQPREAEEEPNK